MAISFTEKQQQVIDTHGCNLLVSAAAGSGKTAVLVERIVKMVSDAEHPVDIDRLLVVTFTNAAAAEMRERISRALNDRLAADPENEHLQRQVTLLHNAQITTIDSFCLFVLRNQFHTIGLDPGFRIGEEGELKLIRQDVLSQVLENCYNQEAPAFLQCMEYFSVGSRDEAVEEVILKLYDFAMSYPFPEQWLMERKKDYQVPEQGVESLPWMEECFGRTSLLLQGCVTKLETAIHLCEEPDGPYPYAPLLEREKDMVEALLRKCCPVRQRQPRSGGSPESAEDRAVWDYDELSAAFGALQFDRLPSKKDETIHPMKREMAKNIRNEVKEELIGLQKQYFFQTKEQIITQMAVCKEAVDALVDVTLAFKEAFDAKKREKNLLDFNDIEHFALSVLVRKKDAGGCEPTETALEYRAYFHEILIDEYQDSNLVQEYLLSCISGEEEGRYNRFMVGDVKQSIYKFRLARPELFLEKYEAYGRAESKVQDEPDIAGKMKQGIRPAVRKIDLHQNFRSCQEVLISTNAVFEQIMGKEVGGIIYDDQAALHPGAVYPPEDNRETELLVFQTGEKPEEMSVKEQEAYGVAMKIKELMREFRVTDKESGQLRKLAFRDIVILLRTTSGWDEVFKKVLEEEGIPVYMTSRTGYFAASEVQELLHFLRILDNPLQDIPLYGVMHSYLGGFTEEEIALIRAAFPKKKYLYDAIESGKAGLPKDLQSKVGSFLEKLNHYRNLAAYLSVHELLQLILRETDYLHYVAVKPEGNKRRANVEMLLVKAAEYEKTSYYGLYQFLRYMEQLEKYEVDYGEAGMQDENADVVRIMSIHKSKGLEFPVCFVSGLAKSFQTKDSTARLVVDVDAGIGVDYVNPQMRVRGRNLRRNVIADKLRIDNLAEEMRILYVAMTRAKEKLILTGTVKSPEKTAASLAQLQNYQELLLPYDVLTGRNSFLELILAALARNRCMDEWYQTCGLEPKCTGVYYEKEMGIRVTLSGWEEAVEEQLEQTVYKEEARRKLLLSDARKDVDTELMTQMSKKFSYQYAYDNLRDLYTKTTVSELKKAGMQEETDFSFKLYEEEPVVPYLPRFIQDDTSVTGSMRGSAFHKVMELFDFTKLTKEVSGDKQAVTALLKEQLECMRAEGRLTEEYYEAVSVSKIVAFLQSRSAFRMAEAARAGRLYKEQPFVLGLPANRLKSSFPESETVLIQGIIDVFFEEEDGYVLLDYKTDAVQKAEELVKRYQIQLQYYAQALEQMSGYHQTGEGKYVKEQIIYSFKLGEEISLSGSMAVADTAGNGSDGN
ncbi:MAG: helicase-exonuclease AddAB subunit AddA [Lachnospiraceae bacterium]